MPFNKKYIVVTGFSEQEIIKEVEDHLKEGWDLQGGVSISITYDTDTSFNGPPMEEKFAQAMVKTQKIGAI